MEAWGSMRTGCTLVKREGAKSIFALSVAGFAHTMRVRDIRLVGRRRLFGMGKSKRERLPLEANLSCRQRAPIAIIGPIAGKG